MRRISISLAMILLVFLSILSVNVEAANYDLDAGEANEHHIDGGKGDIIYIDLKSSSYAIDMGLIREEDYDESAGLWGNEFKFDRFIIDVKSMSWDWKIPSDEEWMLVVFNDNLYSTDYELEITNLNQKVKNVGVVCCICSISFFIIVLILLLIIILSRKRK